MDSEVRNRGNIGFLSVFFFVSRKESYFHGIFHFFVVSLYLSLPVDSIEKMSELAPDTAYNVHGLIVGIITFLAIDIITSVLFCILGKTKLMKREVAETACLISSVLPICFLIVWACAYMHQMNPLFLPEYKE